MTAVVIVDQFTSDSYQGSSLDVTAPPDSIWPEGRLQIAGRCCVDQISAVSLLFEIRHAYLRLTVVIFLDPQSSYDSVARTALLSAFLWRGSPEKIVKLQRASCSHNHGRVSLNVEVSSSFEMTSGDRQG